MEHHLIRSIHIQSPPGFLYVSNSDRPSSSISSRHCANSCGQLVGDSKYQLVSQSLFINPCSFDDLWCFWWENPWETHLTMQNFNKAHRLVENPTWSERNQKKKKSRNSRYQKNRCKTNKWGKTQNVYIYIYKSKPTTNKKNYKTQLELNHLNPTSEGKASIFFFLHFFPPTNVRWEVGLSHSPPACGPVAPVWELFFQLSPRECKVCKQKDPRGYGVDGGWLKRIL